MGSLVIRKVSYHGDNYTFESPRLEDGLNVIVGDNGSGKSTFSYLIEYGFGGAVKPFSKEEKNNKYSIVINDTNNFVELEVEIDDVPYGFKRFISQNEVFVSDGKQVEKYPIYRNKDYAPYIFSDWLLDQLGIPVFELSLGVTKWHFNFSDVYRLLCYDQDTEPRKIYKAPSNENFVSDSSIIRKSIFEMLLGISSIEYFEKHDEVVANQKIKDAARQRLSEFEGLHPGISDSHESVRAAIAELEEQRIKLVEQRALYQKENTSIDGKTENLAKIQDDLIKLDLKISQNEVELQLYKAEANKVERLHSNLTDEISEIKKIIYTHDKLNLFSMAVCPFCMTKKDKQEGYCICGSKFKEADYEKFVYDSSEYTSILKHKEKSLETITVAQESYNSKIESLSRSIKLEIIESSGLKNDLKSAINAIEYSGNSQFVDSLSDKILQVKSLIRSREDELHLIDRKIVLSADYKSKNDIYTSSNKLFQKLKSKFEKDNKNTISAFNEIYDELMAKSSYKSLKAAIDEDYKPYIDGGEYKEKSADVPKRLMYYFTILSLALKLKTVKHPKFLLIDTPETVGIDDDNLFHNLELLNLALELSSSGQSEDIGRYQVILTTGEKKYPDAFSSSIRLRFRKEKGEFIFSAK